MDHANEYNVDGSLLGLGEYILLEILNEMKLPQDAQQFLAVCRKIHQLQTHPRFAKIIQSITQITPAFVIKEERQGRAEGNQFLHSDENQYCTIAIDPVIKEGIVRIEIVFENTIGRWHRIIGIADESCSFAAGDRPQDNGNEEKTVRYWSYIGTIEHITKWIEGNDEYVDGERIAVEVDMTTSPRRVTFFVDDIEQQNSVIGIPEAIRFLASIQTPSSSFTVIKFERLIKSSAQGVVESEVFEWGKEWKNK
ncbi:MAG: hypothetical protein EZS28_032012 [Streblomastix strix]|uniref:Uncharacterized protein n=1 Tax=Streblomastix strix TaxID=222440 RepID=A0A5J4UQY1_9EUKA|nr:MAG: hypothetical protein EZS28_032012 [Streblomastix strix]